MDRVEKARHAFLNGSNCAQAVLVAFQDIAQLDDEKAAILSIGFGGGMGRIRTVCGAFSSMVMLAGSMYGSEGGNPEARQSVYALVQEMQKEFIELNGAYICADLLGKPPLPQAPTPDARTQSYYQTRPCLRVVENACAILEKHLT